MTDEPIGPPSAQRSAPELEFLRRWRPLIDRVGGDGGQRRAAKHLNWTTSTVSRDYKGDTLPTDERLHQLCSALRLSPGETLELARLLRLARSARRARARGNGATVAAEAGPGAAPRWERTTDQPRHQPGHAALSGTDWLRSGRGRLVAGVAAVAVAVAVAFSLSGSGQPPGVRGAFAGLTIDAVPLTVRSLSPSLAAGFRQGKTARDDTITGFVFRNTMDTSLCLTAVNSGPKAGMDGDPVVVSGCRQAANQIWIPEQWEAQGSRFTRLVNDQYQTKCLNADRLGGMHNGKVVQLWDCYRAHEELWDFGDWHKVVSAGGASYPLLAWSSPLCLDADKYDLREGTRVHVWTQYATPNQFWS